MSRIRIKLIRSKIGTHIRQKRTLEALGLTKLGSEKIIENKPELLGMVNKVRHLLEVEEVKK